MGHAEREAMRKRMAQLEEVRRVAANAHVLDRLGRLIVTGCQVLYKNPIDLLYTVDSVTPVFDPRAPAGLHMIKMVCIVELPAMDRVPQELIVVTKYPEEAVIPPTEATTAASTSETTTADTETSSETAAVEATSGGEARGPTESAPGPKLVTES